MKFEELKAKTIAELQQELHSLLREKFSLKIKKGLGEAPPSHNFKEIRRNIARVETVINEKRRAQESYE